MDIEINGVIPLWGIIVAGGGIVASIIKVYYNFIWLEKKFKFWQEDYIVFKTDAQTDIEKCEEDIKEQGNFKGVDLQKLSAAVEELIKSNIQMHELTKYLVKDIEEIKNKLK